MDIVLIIMIVIVSLLLLYVNIYLLALYCHPDDGGFGASLVCKIIVVLCLQCVHRSWASRSVGLKFSSYQWMCPTRATKLA